MSIQKDLNELLEAGIVSGSVAENIRTYYQNKSNSANRLLIAFGILGALLCGLGTILIIAHNWDELARSTKTILAFVPLVLGQSACGFTLWKKQASTTWREASAGFLFLAVGASISLVSQVYNIPGNMSDFLLIWSLVTLPLVYLLRSSVATILYLCGITWYAAQTGYWDYPDNTAYLYFPLFAVVLPFYFFRLKKHPESNFTSFLNWFVPLSLTASLGTLALWDVELMYVAYISLFGLFYQIGQLEVFKNRKLINNGFLIIGMLGMAELLLTFTFSWIWITINENFIEWPYTLYSGEFIAVAILTLSSGFLLFRKLKSGQKLQPFDGVFAVFIPLFFIGLNTPAVYGLFNFLVFALGVWTLVDGSRKNHLGIINFGLLILTALVTCRFFDSDMSFVLRGVLFVLLGAGFFIANFLILKRRKNEN